MKGRTTTSLSLLLLVLATFTFSCAPPRDNLVTGGLPPVMLWAWHGAHDLTFLDPATGGVAFLAGTVRLRGDTVSLIPEARPLGVSSRTVVLPVVRIEIDSATRPVLGRQTLDDVRTAVVGFDDPRTAGLQLDFDATLSQRAFYLELLSLVRDALGDRFLSVTALPSWCLEDRWLPAELIDELVPMVYRMGPESELVRARLAAGRDFAPDCRNALGVSADEPVPAIDPRHRRLYLFNPERWSEDSFEGLLASIQRGKA